MTKLSSVSRTRTPLWQLFFAFLVGFSIQFNALIGGEGGGASATGGYGYRLTDFVAVCAFGLLVLFSIAPHRVIPIGIFGLMVAAGFLYPIISLDPRTSILAMHYALYSFAALYVVIILSKPSAIEWFCGGLIAGVLATVPIFVLQDLNYTQTLITWGLTPGYFDSTGVSTSDVLRYTGVWGHPNEAGHVAALSAAAGAYFAVVRHRYAPLVIVAGSLLAIFYYTMSRGGLIAGGAALVIPFLLSRGRLNVGRLVALVGTVAIAVIVISNIDFVATRFQDPNATSNIQDRFDSILYGWQLIFAHPFGTSTAELVSLVLSGTGGVGSVHNGFLWFGGIFGLLPLALFLVAIAANFRVRNDNDIFFAALAFQVSLSFLFEVLSESYSYVFVMCLIFSWAFLKTRVGALLRTPVRNARRGRPVPTWSGLPS